MKKYIFPNFYLKIVSVLIALGIWLAITTIGEDRQNIYVPVVAEGLNKDRVVLKIDPDGVFLTVKGAISELKNLKKNELRVSINLSRFPEGQHLYHIERKSIILPKGVRVENVHPDAVTVEIDRIIKKKMKVAVRLSDDLGKMYVVKSYHPRFVEVEGAKKTLDSRTIIETVPLKKEIESNETEIVLDFNTEGMIVRNLVPSTVRVKLIKRR